MWVKGWITTLSAMWALRITQLAPMRTPLPSRTLPSKMQLMSISTSVPQCSSPRTSKRAGSAKRTPSSMKRSARAFW